MTRPSLCPVSTQGRVLCCHGNDACPLQLVSDLVCVFAPVVNWRIATKEDFSFTLNGSHLVQLFTVRMVNSAEVF